MTITDLNPPIVVGIDGSEHGLRALDWAAATAMTRNWPLLLVHVREPSIPISRSALLGIDVIDDEAPGTQHLEDARVHVSQLWPTVETSVVSREGSVTAALLEELSDGRMLVLGRRGIGRFAALLTGSVTFACATRANGPVVVVPPAYDPKSNAGRVVVGVDGSDQGEAAVELAFAEASARGAGLEVVHAWEQPSPYGFDFAGYGGVAAWKTDQELAVAEVTAGWQEKYPDVPVSYFVEEDHAAAALVRHSAGADLLVVGGRGHSVLAGKLLGSITHAVIQHAPCAVAVVHETGHHRSR
jgi:nucleotide-binding universal stress UspA family protein